MSEVDNLQQYSRRNCLLFHEITESSDEDTDQLVIDQCNEKAQSKGGFPVMAETTRNHIFSKEISQVIIAAMVLAPNFC